MAAKPTDRNQSSRNMLLGIGLDSDGHKRITTGENFKLIGGSEETHEVMTEKVIKINEKPSLKEFKFKGRFLKDYPIFIIINLKKLFPCSIVINDKVNIFIPSSGKIYQYRFTLVLFCVFHSIGHCMGTFQSRNYSFLSG